jgi:hypothetical protein
MLSPRDLGGAMAACREMRSLMPQGVHALDGIVRPGVVTDEVVGAMLRRFTFLTSVNLRDCSLLRVVTAWPVKLTSVDLSHCSKLTDGAVEALASHCAGLTSVDLSCCSKLTDGAVEALVSHCAGLTSVNLRGCSKLTDGAVEALVSLGVET